MRTSQVLLASFFSTRHYYAPLVHLVSAVIFLVLGASKLIGIAVNLLSLGIVFASVAWISRKLYAKSVTEAEEDSGTPVKTTTLVSVVPALIASCYHFSAWLLHDAFLDFPLIAATAAGFALLVRADDFRVRRHAIAFAISAGLGMLVKQTFAFFFVLPAIYVAGRVLLSRDRRAIANLALATVIFILIASVWYFPHWQDVVAIYRENQQAAVNENEAPLFTFDSNFFYVHAMLSMQMQLPLATLFVLGLVYSLVRSFKKSLVLYLWVLSGIVCFTLVAN